jgi:hypothetical protein
VIIISLVDVVIVVVGTRGGIFGEQFISHTHAKLWSCYS